MGHKFAWYDVKQKAGEKNVALTFDDGPHQILTPKLLDELNLLNAKATFYVMGVKVKLHPYIISRMVAEGHEVANHGWNHPGPYMHLFFSTLLWNANSNLMLFHFQFFPNYLSSKFTTN